MRSNYRMKIIIKKTILTIHRYKSTSPSIRGMTHSLGPSNTINASSSEKKSPSSNSVIDMVRSLVSTQATPMR